MLKKFVSLTLILCLLTSVFQISLLANEDTQAMVDGVYVEYSDATPTYLNGEVYLPLRKTMEALGGNADYNASTNTIVATLKNITVSFKNESPLISIDKNGNTFQKQLDLAPVAHNERMMVPQDFFSQCLNISTSYDYIEDTVVFIDFEKLTKGLDKNYTIINRLLQLGYDPNLTYKTTATYQVNAKASLPEEQNMAIASNMKFDFLSQGENVSFDFNMENDIHFPTLLTENEPETQMILDLLKKLNIQLIYNNDTKTMYIKNAQLNNFLKDSAKMPTTDNTWLQFDLMQTLAGISSTNSLEAIAPVLLQSANQFTVDSYQQMQFLLHVCNTLLSDSAFTTSTKDGIETISYEMTSDTIKKAVISALAQYPKMAPDVLNTLSALDLNAFGDFNLQCQTVITNSHNYTTTLKINTNINQKGLSTIFGEEVEGAFTFSANAQTAMPGDEHLDFKLTMNLNVDDESIVLEETGAFSGNVSITDQAVPAAPEDTSNILDFTFLLSMI